MDNDKSSIILKTIYIISIFLAFWLNICNMLIQYSKGNYLLAGFSGTLCLALAVILIKESL